jgi:hypothetical protein
VNTKRAFGLATVLACAALATVTVARRSASAQQVHADPDENDIDTGDTVDGGLADAPPVLVQVLAADASTPIARGRGVLVTAGELVRRVQQAPDVVQRGWASDPRLLDAVLDRLVADQLLVNEARRLGLERDPAVRAALERALVSRLRATVVVPAAGDASRVTLDEIRQFYEAHSQRFHIPERRAARVIFFTDRHQAERVLTLARAQRHHRPRNDFRQLAEQYNTDPDLLRTSGEIRDVTTVSSDLDAAVRDEIYAIAHPGDVARSLVRGEWHGMHGWFVVRLLSRRPPIDRTLTESSDWIRQRIVLEHRAQTERALIDRLAREAQVTRTPVQQVVRVTVADAGP